MSTEGQTSLRIGAGLSGHMDAGEAARFAGAQALEALSAGSDAAPPPPRLAFVFFSDRHIADATGVVSAIRETLGNCTLVGMSVEGVIGGEAELERVPGVSVLAMAGKGLDARVFSLADLPALSDEPDEALAALQIHLGLDPDVRAVFVLSDPFSVPITKLLPALAGARPEPPDGADPIPVLGAMASGSTSPGGNAMVIDGRIANSGGCIVVLRGPVRVDAVVSQGCRPFGPTMVVTKSKGQLVRTLGQRPALEVLEHAINDLDEDGRKLLAKGLFMGRAASEYKDRFGRGDFLIRRVLGVEKASGALAVEELMRTGQTVRFHVRDARTAEEDLAMLLDGQKLYARPAGVLLLTCNGRGTRLFDAPHHDALAVTRAFSDELDEQNAAPGDTGAPARPTPSRRAVPLAGCFAAGEIGPVGDGVFLHGHTACLAVFRPASR